MQVGLKQLISSQLRITLINVKRPGKSEGFDHKLSS